jgi:signal transduction histidine kinase/ActR/RegA family two-component response regulator
MASVHFLEPAPLSPVQPEGLARTLRARRRLLHELAVRAAVAATILALSESLQYFTGAVLSPLLRTTALTALFINLPYFVIASSGRRLRAQAHVRMLVDVGFLSLGLYALGGLTAAPYASVYVVVPLYAGFALSSRACVAATLASTVGYGIVLLAHHGRWLLALAAVSTTDAYAAVFNMLLVNLVGGMTALLAAAYRRSKRQLLNANRTLERAHERVVEAERLRAIGELSAGVAHHLNNLMAVVLGRIQLALRCADDAGHVSRNLEIAERGLLDASEVVRRMSALSVGQALPESVAVDLNVLAQEVLELTRPRWESEAQIRGLTIEAQLTPGRIVPVAGDPSALREVLMNLIFNAIDALPRGGRITVRTWTDADGVACAVGDNGVGMEPSVQQRALEPFFTTKGLRCTGLGLSVSYGIVRRHGGTLTIDSTNGQGTTVTVRLRPGPAKPLAVPRPAAAAAARLRVLLIDDDANVRAAMADMLALEGHHVIAAASGPDGLARLQAGEVVDVVLTDLGMPGMTGWEVARALKAGHPELPVGLITGWGDEQRARFGDGDIADFVLSKPIRREMLAAALAQWGPAASSRQAKA